MLLKFSTLIGLFLVLGCSKELTLQTYFVEHQEASGFMSVDIPMSFLNPDQIELSDIQKEAVDSIDKLNMLAYSLKDGTDEELNSELVKIKSILKADNIALNVNYASNQIRVKNRIELANEMQHITAFLVFRF